MADNNIIIRMDKTFQAKELNDAVKGLQKAFTNIDKNRKDACLIMWRLEDGKKYEKDGFKSLQDFAESIGIDKSTAHKMADAGRAYDSKIPTIAQFANDAGYTVAANIASMLKDGEQEKALADAIDAKEVTSDMTVDKVKAWKADAIKSSKPEKVLKDRTFCLFDGLTRELISYVDVVIREENDFSIGKFSEDFFKVGTVSGIALWKGDNKEESCNGDILDEKVKWDIYQGRFDLHTVYVTSFPIKKEAKKPATKSAKNMTTEELQAKIAEYQALLKAQAEQK